MQMKSKKINARKFPFTTGKKVCIVSQLLLQSDGEYKSDFFNCSLTYTD